MAWKPDYASLAELKAHINPPITDSTDDAHLSLALTASSRGIDRATNRQFGVTASTEERTYEACWSRTRGVYIARIDDVQTLTGLVVTISGATTTNYALTPTNAAAEGAPWTHIHTASATSPTLGISPLTVLVEATWGWTAVPDTIKQLTLIFANHLFKRRDAVFGVAGSPDLGNELRLLSKLDPDVQIGLLPYRRDGLKL